MQIANMATNKINIKIQNLKPVTGFAFRAKCSICGKTGKAGNGPKCEPFFVDTTVKAFPPCVCGKCKDKLN